jgi:inosine-uridine nucleoside N-ribohydrolase
MDHRGVIAAGWLTIYQGVDDVLAMLLALSAQPEELEVLMLSLTFGNVEVQK